MKIKYMLLVGAGISIALVFMFSLMVYVSFNKVAEENERELIAQEIHKTVSELDIVMYEYLTYREERMLQQWDLRYAATAEIIEKLAEEEWGAIKSNYADLKSLFSKVTANYEKQGSGELEERLVAQILIKSQVIISSCSAIAKEAYNNAIEAQVAANHSMMSAFIVLFVVLVGLSFHTARRITNPLNKLIRGTGIIGKGNLKHRVDIKTKNEIGGLAVAFNQMTENLKKVTASRDELNKEIIERKKTEEDLEDLTKQLEATVEKLTLANRELQHFAHIAAHDLKAPLRAIGTLADWISTDYADKFDKQGKREVELLVGRVVRMGDMIDSILRYSEAGRVVKEKEKVNLNALIEEVMVEIAPPENISITVENELPVLEGEKTHFMQVFQNLLSNAVKYMDKPKGQIKVGCIEQNGFWKFSVADNGPGVEKEYFEKIFEMFQTLLPRDEFETTGVGLSIVKKIVELYGGSVWIESEFGKGSVFFFTLPNQEMKVADDAKLQANIVS